MVGDQLALRSRGSANTSLRLLTVGLQKDSDCVTHSPTMLHRSFLSPQMNRSRAVKIVREGNADFRAANAKKWIPIAFLAMLDTVLYDYSVRQESLSP